MPSRSQRTTNKVLKIVLLGDGGVGKSSLMSVFVHEKYDPYSYHTIGVEFLNKDITSSNIKGLPQHTFTLQIWDTAGQERFKTLRTPFFRGADACLLTFSVDDKGSFESLDKWKAEFLKYADINDVSTFPFIVLGNKIDLKSDKHQITKEMALDWCKRQRDEMSEMKDSFVDQCWSYFETSAKDSINVAAAFQATVDLCAQLYATGVYSINYKCSTVDLRMLPKGEGHGSKCC